QHEALVPVKYRRNIPNRLIRAQKKKEEKQAVEPFQFQQLPDPSLFAVVEEVDWLAHATQVHQGLIEPV
ncbi:hypothetical protein KI387_010400, partial [Taxus chinensis]